MAHVFTVHTKSYSKYPATRTDERFIPDIMWVAMQLQNSIDRNPDSYLAVYVPAQAYLPDEVAGTGESDVANPATGANQIAIAAKQSAPTLRTTRYC